MLKKAKWLLFSLGLVMVFGCITSSQAKEPDDSITALRVRVNQMEQQLAFLEQAIGQVSSYVSKGTEENRTIVQEMRSEVGNATTKFNSKHDSLETSQKQLQIGYQQLLAQYSDLEAKFSELKREVQGLTVKQNQLAKSNQSSLVRDQSSSAVNSGTRSQQRSYTPSLKGRLKRASGIQPIPRDSTSISSRSSTRSSSDFDQMRPSGQGYYEVVVVEAEPYEYYRSPGTIIGRSSTPEIARRSQEAGGFYTKIDTGVIAQWFDRLIH